MTFLPIAARELRVAARKRRTFWLRVAAALVACVVGAGFLLAGNAGGFGTPRTGGALFATLGWMVMGAALAAGLFFTSDCLSEEKREGTLGLLFLTDLRGYDVVTGKLLATSLRCVQMLLAVFPVLAVTLLMGGVSAAQFWQTVLTLGHALMLSLAAGLFVSTLSHDSHRALAGTAALLLALAAGGPAVDGVLTLAGGRAPTGQWSLLSPIHLLLLAGTAGPTSFWSGLFLGQTIAWTLFSLACVLLPRSWQDQPDRAKRSFAGRLGWRLGRAVAWTCYALARALRAEARLEQWGHAWSSRQERQRAARRRQLLDRSPALWLAWRERGPSGVVWALAVVMLGGLGAVLTLGGSTGTLGSGAGPVLLVFWGALNALVSLALYLVVASAASRFFVEAGRSGLMDLLLATPLTAGQIVRGQWEALARRFGAPLAVLLAAHVCGPFAVQLLSGGWAGAAAVPAPVVTPPTNSPTITVTNSAGGTTTVTVGPVAGLGRTWQIPSAIAGTLTLGADLVALLWFGMWAGLTSKTPTQATLKTLAFVQIIPWFVLGFVSVLAFQALWFWGWRRGAVATLPTSTAWWPLLVSAFSTLLYLGKDLGFVLWSRRKLLREFRVLAVAGAKSSPGVIPPPLPPSLPPPPPLPAAK